MQKSYIWLLGILVSLMLGGAGWYAYVQTAAPTYSTTVTPKAVLTKNNQDYADAVAYYKAGKYDLALESYKKAQLVAEDQKQAAQIQINIAVTNEKLGKYADAIAGFKTVAADATNPAIARAYAVQEIGLMYYTFTSARDVIFAETFKDAPYDSFRTDGNANLTYTKLFEYATSLYPLSPSESRIAYGYANEIVTTLHGATTTAQGKSYLETIKQSLQAADGGIERMKVVPEESPLIPETLIREGTTLALLSPLGAADKKDAEPYFRAGLAYGATLGFKPGSFNTFNYAAFLVDQYGMARSADIQTLLAPFRFGNDAQMYPNVVAFFRSARTDASFAKSKKQLEAMGRIDPTFKTFLISLGWKASDF
jgi:tetratricopeptide (TPR) repeat protein